VYNIEEQRINARSAGEGESRVKITYTPRDSETSDDDDSSSRGGDDASDPDDGDGDQ
jgi:hypothetical protein